MSDLNPENEELVHVVDLEDPDGHSFSNWPSVTLCGASCAAVPWCGLNDAARFTFPVCPKCKSRIPLARLAGEL